MVEREVTGNGQRDRGRGNETAGKKAHPIVNHKLVFKQTEQNKQIYFIYVMFYEGEEQGEKSRKQSKSIRKCGVRFVKWKRCCFIFIFGFFFSCVRAMNYTA